MKLQSATGGNYPPPEPVEARDLTAEEFLDAFGELAEEYHAREYWHDSNRTHLGAKFGPASWRECPDKECQRYAALLAANQPLTLHADTARVPEGLDVDGFLTGLAARPELDPAWRDGIEYARLKLALATSPEGGSDD